MVFAFPVAVVVLGKVSVPPATSKKICGTHLDFDSSFLHYAKAELCNQSTAVVSPVRGNDGLLSSA
jgi:hypothetical protein